MDSVSTNHIFFSTDFSVALVYENIFSLQAYEISTQS